MNVNKVNQATQQALVRGAEWLRYQNKQMQIKQMEESLRQEKLRIARIKPSDPDKGNNVDVTV